MLKIIFRGPTQGTIVGILCVIEMMGLVIYSTISADGGYPLLGIVLVAGVAVLLVGGFNAQVISEQLNDPTSSFAGPTEIRAMGAIALTALTVVLVALGSLADRPEASGDVRLAGWIPLLVFSLITTSIAAACQGATHNEKTSRPSGFFVRWVFMLTFLYPALHLHFELPLGGAVVVFVLQLGFIIAVIFDFQRKPRVRNVASVAPPVESEAASEPVPTSTSAPLPA